MLYIIQVTICWACFYALYQLLYKRETFFQLNRAYLLSTLLLGLLLPFDWSSAWTISHESTPLPAVYLQPLVVGAEVTGTHVKQWSFDFKYWLSMTYVFGASIFTLRFLGALWQLYSIFRKGRGERKGSYIVVKTGKQHLPFSFFRYIFWGEFPENDASAKNLILQHELAHIEQKHSIDTLLLELLGIVFWCSPMVYLYKKSLKTVHEYLADAAVTAQNSKKDYGTILLRQVNSGTSPALVHPFHSQLKLRFAMLLKRNSSRWAYLKYALCLPTLLIISVLLKAQTDSPTFTIDPYGGGKIGTYKDFRTEEGIDTIVTFDPVTFVEEVRTVNYKDTIYFKPDKPAEFIGGQAEFFKLLGATVKYPQAARDKGIEGKNVIQFAVTKRGFIDTRCKIRKSSGNKLLDEETFNVILRLSNNESESRVPYFKPGEKNGKPVATEFLLPMVYKLEAGEKKQLPDKQ
jgi:TonB family protein